MFSFWKAEVPGLAEAGQGATFVIPAGHADAGTWRIGSVHRDDGEVIEVVATRG